MAEGRIVKFCAQVGPRCTDLVTKNCPPDGRDQFDNFTPHEISLERLKLQTSNLPRFW